MTDTITCILLVVLLAVTLAAFGEVLMLRILLIHDKQPAQAKAVPQAQAEGKQQLDEEAKAREKQQERLADLEHNIMVFDGTDKGQKEIE